MTIKRCSMTTKTRKTTKKTQNVTTKRHTTTKRWKMTTWRSNTTTKKHNVTTSKWKMSEKCLMATNIWETTTKRHRMTTNMAAMSVTAWGLAPVLRAGGPLMSVLPRCLLVRPCPRADIMSSTDSWDDQNTSETEPEPEPGCGPWKEDEGLILEIKPCWGVVAVFVFRHTLIYKNTPSPLSPLHHPLSPW